jgi:type IV secretory pathway VirB2 component (pilin)
MTAWIKKIGHFSAGCLLLFISILMLSSVLPSGAPSANPSWIINIITPLMGFLFYANYINLLIVLVAGIDLFFEKEYKTGIYFVLSIILYFWGLQYFIGDAI